MNEISEEDLKQLIMSNLSVVADRDGSEIKVKLLWGDQEFSTSWVYAPEPKSEFRKEYS